MNLRELEYVVAVADLRSFSAAAERCCVSQPTLSVQVKKLEEQLGAELFERTNKRVMLTDVGAAVVSAARRILVEVDTIKQVARAAHDPLAGAFRLGAFPTLASYLFPDLVPRLTAAAPNLKLILVEEKTDILANKLRRGEIDAALLALPVEDDGLAVRALFEDPFHFAVWADHPMAGAAAAPIKAMGDWPLLLLEEGHCLRAQALDVCELAGAEDEPDMRATSLETLRQMVRAGTGVTLMPEIAVPLRGDDGVRYIPFEGEPPARTIGLVHRKSFKRDALVDVVAECARDAYGTRGAR